MVENHKNILFKGYESEIKKIIERIFKDIDGMISTDILQYEDIRNLYDLQRYLGALHCLTERISSYSRMHWLEVYNNIRKQYKLDDKKIEYITRYINEPYLGLPMEQTDDCIQNEQGKKIKLKE